MGLSNLIDHCVSEHGGSETMLHYRLKCFVSLRDNRSLGFTILSGKQDDECFHFNSLQLVQNSQKLD